MSLDRPAADLLAAAKLWLTSSPVPAGSPVGDMPYLSSALYSLVTVPTDRVATMASDPAWRLYVNPNWLGDPARSTTEVARELAHHVWHLLADHAGRASDIGVTGSTSRAWRVATDVTLHELLGQLPQEGAASSPLSAGGAAAQQRTVDLARASALGDQHDLVGAAGLGLPLGRAAEEYFALLTGLPTTDDDPDRDPAWVPRAAHAGDPPMQGDPGTPPDPSCGSGCDGLHRGYELPNLADDAGVSAVAAEAIRRTVAIAIQAQRGQGNVPGEWGRWVSHILDPVVDWRNVLHAAVRRGIGWASGHTDYTYTRISRRQSAAGPVILPALRRHVPRVAVVIDTSGSVDDGLLAQALGEIEGVLRSLGVADPQVTVLAVDAAVQSVSQVRRADAVRLAGGGGTDMAVGIRAAQELRPRVEVIIVLTDGLTGWPARPTEVPTIAVLIGRSRADLPTTPDWVQRVECVH
jgi:predicted metal-dependent peptidase